MVDGNAGIRRVYAAYAQGAADAHAVIDVRLKGELIDHQEWGRVVNLTSPWSGPPG